MARKGILVFFLVLFLAGCGTRPCITEDDPVVSLLAGDDIIPGTDYAVQKLVVEFNRADYYRTGRSGPATHRLHLLTAQGVKYNIYRINKHVVEVGLRREKLRQKFFLVSPALSELIRDICEGEAILGEPTETIPPGPELPPQSPVPGKPWGLVP